MGVLDSVKSLTGKVSGFLKKAPNVAEVTAKATEKLGGISPVNALNKVNGNALALAATTAALHSSGLDFTGFQDDLSPDEAQHFRVAVALFGKQLDQEVDRRVVHQVAQGTPNEILAQYLGKYEALAELARQMNMSLEGIHTLRNMILGTTNEEFEGAIMVREHRRLASLRARAEA